MAWNKKAAHKNTTIVYSVLELRDWMRRARRSEQDNTAYARYKREALPHGTNDCPVCGWPVGVMGFIVAPALAGEWPFGKVFGCPRCWPPVIGENVDAQYSTSVEADTQLTAARIRLSSKGLL